MSGRDLNIKGLCDKIHSTVTFKYPYVADQQQYQTPDYWEKIARAGKGDCEDYVLEMKWELFELGVPEEDLRIGICVTETKQDHAVLVVTDQVNNCDWILDQRQSVVLTPDELTGLGYTGIMIQRPGHFLWRRWKI